jgi:DNA-binding CsgD family transcriptional regulator
MRLLVPHLDRAVRLQLRSTSAGLRADLLSGALDALTLGVVLVDAAGLPLWLNRRAREILESSNALRVGPAGLIAATRSDNQSLNQLINKAISDGAQGLLAISRGVEVRSLLLVTIPLKPQGAHEVPAGSPCAAIFISDPDRVDNPSVEALRRAFDLTYREAQTAIAVANGHGLKAAAKSMGVAVTTARSQLQQAFAKTGTGQQAELAALVHRTLAQLRYDRSASKPVAGC